MHSHEEWRRNSSINMFEFLFWVYLINSVLLINHEIDSAYWKEWDLFKLPGGITGFLILHIPIVFLVIYGLILVFQQTFPGLIFSLVLSISGLFAFTVHTIYIKKGRNEFKVPVSIFLLTSVLIVSLIQVSITVHLLLV
jgi:hypothetical protein